MRAANSRGPRSRPRCLDPDRCVSGSVLAQPTLFQALGGVNERSQHGHGRPSERTAVPRRGARGAGRGRPGLRIRGRAPRGTVAITPSGRRSVGRTAVEDCWTRARRSSQSSQDVFTAALDNVSNSQGAPQAAPIEVERITVDVVGCLPEQGGMAQPWASIAPRWAARADPTGRTGPGIDRRGHACRRPSTRAPQRRARIQVA